MKWKFYFPKLICSWALILQQQQKNKSVVQQLFSKCFEYSETFFQPNFIPKLWRKKLSAKESFFLRKIFDCVLWKKCPLKSTGVKMNIFIFRIRLDLYFEIWSPPQSQHSLCLPTCKLPLKYLRSVLLAIFCFWNKIIFQKVVLQVLEVNTRRPNQKTFHSITYVRPDVLQKMLITRRYFLLSFENIDIQNRPHT